MEEIKNRISYALKQNRMTPLELSQKTGIPKSSISQYMSGYSKPKSDRIYLICDALGVNETWLLGYDVPMEKDNKTKLHNEVRGIKIPVLGSVVAGIPIEAIEEIIDYEEISEQLAKTGEFFALRIKGDSMEPRMYDGDVVIVRKQEEVDSGDVAIVLVNGDEATVKRVKIDDNGIMMIPFNPKYTPWYYTAEECEYLPVRILGKVVECRQKY